MAKFKSPKTNDPNEAASKIAAQPSAQESHINETAATFSPATSTTNAESAKPKANRNRAAKPAVAPTSVPQTSAVPKLAVPSEGRTNGEARNSEAPSRNEGRGNVVPINLEDEIRKVAYLLSERRGFAPGYEREDWLAAEHEVLQRYRQQSA